MKTSTGKATWRDGKQVWRHHAKGGNQRTRDVIALHDEPPVAEARTASFRNRVKVDRYAGRCPFCPSVHAREW
jgi:hypothetical protein